MGRFPRFFARTAALRLLVATIALVFSRAVVPEDFSGDDETSQVPGQPLRTCHVSQTPVGRLAEVPGMMPCAFAIPVLPSALTTASATTTVPFGAQLHGPYARCLRFANAVADAHARLASACRPPAWAVGTSTRRLLSEISGRYHPSFPTRLFLAHRQVNLLWARVGTLAPRLTSGPPADARRRHGCDWVKAAHSSDQDSAPLSPDTRYRGLFRHPLVSS